MMHHSRLRLPLLALVIVLIGICLRNVANKMGGPGRSSHGKVESSATPPESAAGVLSDQADARRSREGKALAKFRSLLKVRQGELAVIRIPPNAALAETGESVLGPPTEADGPTIHNVRNIEQFSKQLEVQVSGDDSVDGVVKAADDFFEWRLSDLELKGRGLPNSDEETTLKLDLRLGERELVTTFTGNVGSMFLVHPGGEEDALLLVLGGEKPAGGEE